MRDDILHHLHLRNNNLEDLKAARRANILQLKEINPQSATRLLKQKALIHSSDFFGSKKSLVPSPFVSDRTGD